MNVDWEMLEMEYPGLVGRIDVYDRKIETINRAFDRGAGCVTRDPEKWSERVNRYALECVAVYEELLVREPSVLEFSYPDMALLREARDAAEEATPTPEGMGWFLTDADGVVYSGPFDSMDEAIDSLWPTAAERDGVTALTTALLPIGTEVRS